jgi:hypothetical protein
MKYFFICIFYLLNFTSFLPSQNLNFFFLIGNPKPSKTLKD